MLSYDIETLSVPYGKSVHGEAEIEAVVRVLKNSTQMGDSVRQFEHQVAQLFSKPYGIMVNSGSSANYLAIELLKLPAGSEVITPVLTFSTTVAPLVRNSLVPVFIDVSEGTYNINADLIERAITERTKAMMIPNLIGNLPDWKKIRAIADRYQLMVIEDSADTLGATFLNESTGIYSDISTTSFYGSHVINCAGNGGMLCVKEKVLADRAKLLRSWGRDSSLFVESEKIENRFNVKVDGIPYDAKFVFSELGYNFEPSELGAAFGLVQLNMLLQNIQIRRENFKSHRDFFSQYEEFFILPQELTSIDTGWLAFPLTIKESAPFTRTELQIYFEKHRIQTRTVFTGNILRQPAMKGIKCVGHKECYPYTDQVMRGGMLIGCHQGLKSQHIEYIHFIFKEFLKGKQ